MARPNRTPAPPAKDDGVFAKLKVWLERYQLLAGLITTVAAVLYFGPGWLDSRIDERFKLKLNDPAILRSIAEFSRPALLFDDKESILSDMGAAQFVKDQRIHIASTNDLGMPHIIEIDFTKHIANPPSMTALYDSAKIEAKRGKGFSWQFDVFYIVSDGAPSTGPHLYKLELAP